MEITETMAEYPSPADTRDFPAHGITPPGTVNLADFEKDDGRQNTQDGHNPVILIDGELAKPQIIGNPGGADEHGDVDKPQQQDHRVTVLLEEPVEDVT